MGNRALEQKARELVGAPYTIEIFRDQANDGSKVFVARVVEMPGCIAQGSTRDEAIRALQETLQDVILGLLEDNLPVPRPAESRGPESMVSLFDVADGDGQPGTGSEPNAPGRERIDSFTWKAAS